eukprot:840647-Pyramimonas_sp.AAC.1
MSSQRGNTAKKGAPTYHNDFKFKPDRAVKLSQTVSAHTSHFIIPVFGPAGVGTLSRISD